MHQFHNLEHKGRASDIQETVHIKCHQAEDLLVLQPHHGEADPGHIPGGGHAGIILSSNFTFVFFCYSQRIKYLDHFQFSCKI